MANKKIVYDIILSIWNLIRSHCFEDNKMSDEQWELLIKQADEEIKKVRSQHGREEAILYSKMFNALAEYVGEKDG